MTSSYDFIIVGGGTAGLVVAARLSEDASKSVLVLEAGSDLTEDPRAKIPLFYAALLGSDADWAFRSEPQTHLNGRAIALNQGKALGGSSVLNAHVFVPPARSLIDSWELLGNKGWNWYDFQKYCSKSFSSPKVDSSVRKALGVESWSANDQAKGLLQTCFPGEATHPIREAWANFFQASGQYMSNDPFIDGSVGGFSCLASIDPSKGERSYSASAYYKPIKDRNNLVVLLGAHVEKVLLEKRSGLTKATGVEYLHNDVKTTAIASKEVILAAGVFQSPKLLELSGIGNGELLNKHGINVIEDLPGVGENLQDHLISYTAFQAADNLDTKDALIRQEPEALGQAMQEYGATQSGPLASLGVNTYAYLPLPTHDQTELKTLLAHGRPSSVDSAKDARAKAFYDIAEATLLSQEKPSAAYLTALGQTNFPLDINSATRAPAPSPGKFVSFGVMLSHPLSRGSVHIGSHDPNNAPVIDPNYLSHPLDVEVMARHMLRIKTIAGSQPFRELLAEPLTYRDPAAEFANLEAAKEYARAKLVSMWHFAGTCAMLPRDKAGVVDPKLKVYGLENLRIVDASAIPLVSTANLQATVYAFAEKAADLIKEAWKME